MSARIAALLVSCGVIMVAFGAVDADVADPSWWVFVRIVIGGAGVVVGVRLAIAAAVHESRKGRDDTRV